MKAKECRVRRHIESRDRKNSNLLLKYLQEKAKIAKSLLNKIVKLLIIKFLLIGRTL